MLKGMKIQLDTDQKIIRLEDDVNLGEFFKKIKKLVPDYKDWKLETNTVINNWTNPIVIEPYYPRPWNEWYPYRITSGGTSGDSITYSDASNQVEPQGTMNFEV